MKTRVAINGFGRIGRYAFRRLFENDKYEIVAINDITSTEMLAYLLKYDTTQGTFEHAENVNFDDKTLYVCGKGIPVFSEPDASNLPWRELSVDIVLECSGAYRSRNAAQKHIAAGARKVVISAPAGVDVPVIVFGVNHDILTHEDAIISAASCSTNALAPMVKILNDHYPVAAGIMTVIHGYTATQVLQDGPQHGGNLRRSRAAAENIIPTTAEAAKAVGLVIPELAGKLDGSAVRVPVPVGCLLTFTAVVAGQAVDTSSINAVMEENSSETFGYTEEEYVSSDIIGMTQASLFDASQTLVCKLDDTTYEVRIAAWFDNETSFTSQMLRLAEYVTTMGRR